MSQKPEDAAVDLDSSSSLEFERRLVVQESVDPFDQAKFDQCAAGHQHCGTKRREILQQPFECAEFRGA